MATQAQRSARARNALLAAAARLIAVGGASVSVADIGMAAGMSRGAVNFHFGDKSAMLKQLVEYCSARLADAVPRAAGWATLSEAIDAHYEPLLTQVEGRTLLMLAHAALGAHPELAAPIAAKQRQATAHAEVVVRELAGIGAHSPTRDYAALAQVITGALCGLALETLLEPDPATLQSAYDELVLTLQARVAG